MKTAFKHVVEKSKPFLDGYYFYEIGCSKRGTILKIFSTWKDYIQWSLSCLRVDMPTKDLIDNDTVHRLVFSGRDALRVAMKSLPSFSESEIIDVLEVTQELELFDFVEPRTESKRFGSEEKYKFLCEAAFASNVFSFSTKCKNIGAAAKIMGMKPKYGVVIVPGFASSALEAWIIESNKSWFRERVWVDPTKIGSAAPIQMMKDEMSKKIFQPTKSFQTIKKEEEKEKNDGREWIRIIIPQIDGFSDPPNVKIRPVKGLQGIDYLATSPIIRKSSYVFGPLIKALVHLGFDYKNLHAASYDWRLSPQKLQERDGYFTELKNMIRSSFEINDQKVVLMAHSMGNRIVGYFLNWLEINDPDFADRYIYSWMALGAPFLGAPKAARSLMTGDAMGLDFFLRQPEAVTLARRVGSSPLLLPLCMGIYPDHIFRIEKEKEKYEAVGTFELIHEISPNVCDIVDFQYKVDPFSYGCGENFMKSYHGDGTDFEDGIPLLRPPRVPRLWNIYGVDVPTEVGYFYKKSKSELIPYKLDSHMDKYSHKIHEKYNPKGMKVGNGIMWEIPSTFQPFSNRTISGDGTVPYASLSFPQRWATIREKTGKGVEVISKEMPFQKHREMLKTRSVCLTIIQFLCGDF